MEEKSRFKQYGNVQKTKQTFKSFLLYYGPYYFEQMENFKYLGVNINEKNNIHNEIQVRISVAICAYFTINKMLSFKKLPKNSKEKLYAC